jgi:hypothetical protein
MKHVVTMIFGLMPIFAFGQVKSLIASGGHQVSESYTIQGSFGQLAINQVSSSNYHLSEGFNQIIDEAKESVKFNNGLKLFPNPTNGLLHINNPHKINEISILGINGNQISNHTIDENHACLDVSYLMAGIYLFKIRTIDNSTISKKIIIL